MGCESEKVHSEDRRKPGLKKGKKFCVCFLFFFYYFFILEYIKGQKETRLHANSNLGVDMKCLRGTGKGPPGDGAKLKLESPCL